MVKIFDSLIYPYSLPDIPYAYDALEPHIDAKTMEIHHTKHHAAYVNNLNKALELHTVLQNRTLSDLLSNPDQLPDTIRQTIINHGGGHANHTLFWETMTPGEGSKPQGKLNDLINQTFGSFEAFRNEFVAISTSHFGSGWSWLSFDINNQSLILESLTNQNSPITQKQIPLLGLDLWEHAYYLKYQNRRIEYIESWWNLVNWDKVGEILASSSSLDN